MSQVVSHNWLSTQRCDYEPVLRHKTKKPSRSGEHYLILTRLVFDLPRFIRIIPSLKAGILTNGSSAVAPFRRAA